MRRFCSVLLALALILTATSACAYDFASLRRLQDYIYEHSTRSLMDAMSISCFLHGTVQTLTNVTGNHWEMEIAADDPDAIPPLGSETGVFVAHFRLHMDPCPVAVGDYVILTGDLNPLYSSSTIPMIVVETINGTDDF